MIELLSRIFIKNKDGLHPEAVRTKYGMLCGGVGIFFNILLFAAKLFASAVSGSVAVAADAFNNLSDAGSSVVTLIGFKIAGQKPDPEHPFGHGRVEYLSGLIVSLIILLMGSELLKTSLGKIFSPESVEISAVIVIILVISVLVKFYMAYYNNKTGKIIQSAAMKATAVDSLSDCIATSAVLISMIISYFADVNIDGYCGAVVSVFILVAGFKAAKETVSPLLGQPPEQDFIEKIKEITLSHDSVVGIHDLIVHDYGPGRRMISLHAEVSSTADILKTHDEIDNIEKELIEKLGCSAVIHMDPIATDDETLEVKSEIFSIVCEINDRITLHDFRMVAGPTHTNLIFDIAVPYDVLETEAEIKEMIEKKIKKKNDCWFCVITLDRTYCEDDK